MEFKELRYKFFGLQNENPEYIEVKDELFRPFENELLYKITLFQDEHIVCYIDSISELEYNPQTKSLYSAIKPIADALYLELNKEVENSGLFLNLILSEDNLLKCIIRDLQ